MERDNRLIEPPLIRQRFARALPSYDNHAIAQQQITAEAAAMLQRTPRPFARCLEIGCGSGGFTHLLQQMLPEADWTLNDLCPESLSAAALHCPHSAHLVTGDAESAELGTGYDLIASTSAFQWFRRPQGFVRKLAAMQPPGGTLLFTTFLPGNLQEVKEITGRGLTYPSAGQWKEWLAHSYRIEVCRDETIRLLFGNPLEVLRHLKYTGVTATGTGQWTRGMQADFISRYNKQFSTGDGRVTLTYRPLYIQATRRQKTSPFSVTPLPCTR
ncbi:malonyl-[acyl-carrier protein] O-methyltransferase BioC [Bacteroides sp. AM07-16]|nr:malonyl-[acyl-carrier protein] O-methyltransferase BioC [Bacteroides sp. AM07-16]